MDGDLDAFVTNAGGNEPNKVWINDGSGNFTDSGQSLGLSNSVSAELGDVDGDGDADDDNKRGKRGHGNSNNNGHGNGDDDDDDDDDDDSDGDDDGSDDGDSITVGAEISLAAEDSDLHG